MEIQSNSRIIEAKRQLKVFLTSSEKLDKSFCKKLELLSSSKFTKSLENADVILNIRNNKFFFSTIIPDINFQIPSMPLTDGNIKSAFTLLHGKFQSGKQNLRLAKKRLTSAKKSFSKSTSHSAKLATTFSKQSRSAGLTKLISSQKEIITLYEKANSIEELSEVILSLSDFKNHVSCQFLIHERGKVVVDSYSFSKELEQDHSEFQLSNFNSIYNYIKKSKNKLFTQSQLLKESESLIGTLLAKEFNLEGYNIVFLISRNDFLPPSPEEQLHFDQFTQYLAPLLQLLLVKNQIQQKNAQYLQALNSFDRPLLIVDGDGDIIFSNEEFKKRSDHYLSNLNKFFNSISISGNRRVLIPKYESDSLSSDIHHFQRITLLGELLNTLQHELSNPLFGVKLAADILSADSTDPESEEILEDISVYAKRCQTIIENFSYLYKDEQKYSQIDLQKIITETITLTKSETRSIAKNVVADSSEPFLIYSNPTWITQIIFNVIINASQAIKGWTDDLRNQRILIELKAQPAGMISISIADSGPGITDDKADKLFSPFYTTKEKGTGLGLAICNNLISKLGGEISFSNHKELGGACFEIKLPAQLD